MLKCFNLQKAERQIHDLALKISTVEKEATEQVTSLLLFSFECVLLKGLFHKMF
jgi:hypothetical protein